MRVVVPLIALILGTDANAAEVLQISPPQANEEMVLKAPKSGAVCRDTIQEVRRELGRPALDRDSSGEEPLLIAAVDKRVGGCSVMVMRNDTSDLRPLPGPAEHRMMPAK